MKYGWLKAFLNKSKKRDRKQQDEVLGLIC